MRLPALLILFAALLLAACAPVNPTALPVLPGLVTLTPPAATLPAPTETPVESQPTETNLPPSPTASQELSLPVPTPTPSPTYIPYLPTPTETLLPPLELPTEQPNSPALVPWTGLPTYPGDSQPGLLSRVDYDPDIWAQLEGNFGSIVLAHRQLDYCTITPWTGRGLPVDWKATHDFRVIGRASFDVSIITSQDVVKFVSYVGGDGQILTGFQVQFNTQRDKCLRDAETVLGTLRSFAAIPTPTSTTLPATSTP